MIHAMGLAVARLAMSQVFAYLRACSTVEVIQVSSTRAQRDIDAMTTPTTGATHIILAQTALASAYRRLHQVVMSIVKPEIRSELYSTRMSLVYFLLHEVVDGNFEISWNEKACFIVGFGNHLE